MKPAGSPEEIAAAVLLIIDTGVDCPDVVRMNYGAAIGRIAAALKAHGDRRGEEERAKALEPAAVVLEKRAAEEWKAGVEARQHPATRMRHEHRSRAFDEAAQAIRSLAAAPSGDAKGTK